MEVTSQLETLISTLQASKAAIVTATVTVAGGSLVWLYTSGGLRGLRSYFHGLETADRALASARILQGLQFATNPDSSQGVANLVAGLDIFRRAQARVARRIRGTLHAATTAIVMLASSGGIWITSSLNLEQALITSLLLWLLASTYFGLRAIPLAYIVFHNGPPTPAAGGYQDSSGTSEVISALEAARTTTLPLSPQRRE